MATTAKTEKKAKKAKIGVLGASGYTGAELLRLLIRHPRVEIVLLTADRRAGKTMADVFPQFAPYDLPVLTAIEGADWKAAGLDLAFCALPHGTTQKVIADLLKTAPRTKVVDLSADFRLADPAAYAHWYGHAHAAPALQKEAVYGLTEVYRAQIKAARLVANPGCYATASILALVPAIAAGIIQPGIIIDAKSGVSGAGRTPSLTTLYDEVNENINAYSLNGHRHLAEITQELTEAIPNNGYAGQEQLRVTFIPHLVPMTRGILATCYADLKQDSLTTEDVQELYEKHYADEPFVHVVDSSPHTKWSYGSNHCFIHPFVDVRTQRLVVVSCLDNLVKGASGQAIQNANILYSLPETTGLTALAVYP